jgi:predicted ATPase/DNA-binding CsgD family transcriptional regulator
MAGRGYGTSVGRPSAATVGGGVHGFPAMLTSFIGRDGPVREVAGLLEEYRLVTVTGPGGSGKTRLAGPVAKLVIGRFADGAWLAELAPVRDPAQVAPAVAAALGIREQPGVPAEEMLARVLARQQVLLVLDNCEHVIGAAAQLCAGLLAACDDVRVLATSRESLGVAGEARYRLAPLSLPGPDDHGGGSEAVALFADRARRADARFTLDRDSGPAVAKIVARLDGMPLAIELAAARVEALGVAQLLDRLDDRFALLAGGDRLAAGRHRSLAAAVQWSYQLLDDDERRVFRRVSVFPGPFTLEAAEAVAGAGAGAAVLRLVDCSLVSPPQAGPDGRSRYQMLETLRAYGSGLLAQAGEDCGAAAALAGYAIGVAEEAAAGLRTSTADVAAARRLDAEDAAMRQALAWATEKDTAMALRLAVALAPWWYLRARFAEAYPLLREASAHGVVGSDLWCDAQYWLGRAMLYSADLAGALGHFTAVCDALTGRPLGRAPAACLAARAGTLAHLGRIAEAVDDGRRALALARDLGCPFAEHNALTSLIVAADVASDLDGALELARQAGQVTGDIPGFMTRNWSCIMTNLLTSAGDLGAAEATCAAGLARAREADDLWVLSELLNFMSELDLQANRTQDAAAHLGEALRIASRTGGGFEVLNGLHRCAWLCAATGRPADALTAWAAFAASCQRAGTWLPRDRDPRHPLQEALNAARQALGPDRARAAEERGAAMSLETATEYALMLTTPAPQPPGRGPGPGKLSTRERELVALVARGRTDAQIAAELYISVRTVRTHLDRIRDKTGCRRRADLTRLALQAQLA